MPTTHSAYDWLRARALPRPAHDDIECLPAPAYERDGRAEVDRLHREIQELVSGSTDGQPRAAVDSALDAVARLQVTTANIEAANPPTSERLGRALVALADRQLMGHSDAIERGMTYTADNTMRKLIHDAPDASTPEPTPAPTPTSTPTPHD